MPDNELTAKLLEDLNAEQKEAMIYENGPLLIIAGAGTGKTTVITRRIAWLILTGRAKPEEIMAVTFTDKAAQEMEERVDKLLPYGYVDLWISTFHSFCERILKNHALDIGLPMGFKLLNTVQQAFLIRENFDRFDLDYYKPLGNPTKFIHELVKHFSRLKDECISPKEYLEYAENLKLDKDSAMSDEAIGQEAARIREVANAYHTYQQLLLDNNAMDFGDLINYTIELFKKRLQILEKYRNQFKYILVDEFQDTNWAQYELLKLLAAPKNNLTAVGDDKQAIYRWRGASYNNVVQFRKDFPASKLVFLINNYRSGQEILNSAYNFIEQNYIESAAAQFNDLLSKNLKATKKEKSIVEHIHAKMQEDEAKEVIKKIMEIREKCSTPAGGGASWNDFAILVRANHQAEIFCQALRWNGIPYQFLARQGLFSKPIIIDILAYLKLLDDYHESPALYRLLISPIFATSLKNDDIIRLVHFANKKTWSLYEAIKKARLIIDLSPTAIQEFEKILGWIDKHTQIAKKESVGRAVYAFLEDSGYLNLLSSAAEKDGEENVKNIFWLNQFFKKIEDFERVSEDKSVNNFVRTVELMIETGETGALEPETEAGPEAVKVMTIHGAKGLEFRFVFIVNLVDRRFPTIERAETIEIPQALIKEIVPPGDVHLQEERRLFYVAMTRAKDGLFFTSAENYGGKTTKKFSRFLYELGMVKKEEELKTIAPEPKILKTKFALEKTPIKSEQIQLPTKFSFSQLAAFEKCPLQYKFAFLLRIPRRGRYTFSFGQSIHNTLRQFFGRWLSIQTQQTGLFADKKTAGKPKIELKELFKIYEELWIDEWYEDKTHQMKYKERGKEILKNFYEEFIKNPPNTKHLELGFNFKLKEPVSPNPPVGGEGGYVLKGVIDRIDAVEGGLEILDYKTGASKAKLSKEDKKQLLIYQLAARELFREPVQRLTYHYLESGEKASFLGTDSELKETEEKVKTTIEEIKKSDFHPTPSKLCEWCDFKSVCEYRQI